ncbi:MAG TPA: hypothetical protein VHD33_06095, partial [Legionellaceae bacterium]|nr:hypothetical protein [Legionellaceae bacterium]
NVGFSGNASYEIYTIGAGTWGAETTIPNNLVYENKNLVTLPNGHVVGLYGYSSAAHTTALGFTYDGATFTSIAANTLWTDSSAKWNVQLTSIANGTATIKNKIVVTGGTYDASASFGYAPTANIEEYDEVGNIWLTPDPATNNSILLSSDGLSLAKTDEYVFKSTVPAGANYTPSSIVNALNSSLIGASATTYLTNRLRVNTNSFDTNGDIALLTQNTNSAALQLEDTDHIDNLFENIGFVESASFLGTPSFKDAKVIAATEIDNPIVSVVADSGYSLVGLKNWMGGMDNSTTYHPTPYTYPRFGNNYKFYSEIASATGFSTVTDLITRKNPSAGWLPGDRVYLAAPYAIGPRDTLNLIVDNDITKQFAINMFRKLKPTTNTYGITNASKDISGGNVSLATTFGLNFNFNDFAVYMPARGIAFNGDNSREMLFRYYRPGNDGINTQVAFGNPMGPNQDLYTYTSQVGSNIQVTVRLASGALKSITADSSTRIGQLSLGPNYSAQLKEIFNLAISNATRTADVTTLTLTLPTPATDHGLNVGDLIWVNSTSPTYSSGIKPISARTATTISYSEINGDNAGTANIGDVSFSSLGECTFQGSGAIIGDWFRFNDPLLSQYSNATFYISAVDGAGRNLTVLSGDQIDGLSFPVNTTIQWAPISQSTNIQIFANANQTASQIITAINAAAALENSTCPITATSLGTGFGVINQCTIDAIHNVNAFYSLLDGMNYVSVTAAPGSPAGDYQLTFKNPINGTLSANADWQNEIVYICPTTAQNVVDWLNAPTVTGLSTVCNIQTSNKGQSVQINTLTAGSRGGVEVQGGFANSATATVIGPAVNLPNDISYTTISNADSTGLTYGTWCRIQNTINAPFFPFTAGMQVTSWTPDGQITFNSNLVTRTVNRTQAKLQFEKQGNFIAISDMGLSGAINFSSVTSSCWVRITTPTSPTLPPVALGNQGIYRILRLN